ncbi:MAG: PIN domain-containing protein [Bacillota bacterium]
MLGRLVRLFLIMLIGLVGFAIAYYSTGTLTAISGVTLTLVDRITILALGAVIGMGIGYVLAPLLVRGTSWAESRLYRTPMQDIISGAIGLIIGLIIANLLGGAFAKIPGLGVVLPTVGSVILGYLGVSVAIKKRDEISGAFGFIGRAKDRGKSDPKILDTSVIIDGRIADVVQCGFLEGPLVIPAFVLEELRHIADSSDVLKRNRGRRGLDVLNRIQKEMGVTVQIYERDFGALSEVDSKLVRVAKALDGKIVTNDYNLNKVAELQGIRVLNLNDLANAVKPVVLPGEDMTVHVIKDGKEAGQGVAYLDDGTMIVVDGGRRHIGDHVEVSVTSVLQTSAGRMIFARLKSAERAL